MKDDLSIGDCYRILGLQEGVRDTEVIRGAYLEQVKRHPPESNSDRFEQIRDAYQLLANPERAVEAIFKGQHLLPLAQRLDGLRERRIPLGLEPWQKVLNEA